MKEYNATIRFEFHRSEEYKLECDTDEEAVEKAKDMVIDGFSSIETDEPSYCHLNVMDGERIVYDNRLYPCRDGLTEHEFIAQLGDYAVEETENGAILTSEDGHFCTFNFKEGYLIWDAGDLEVGDDEFKMIPELVAIEQKLGEKNGD